MADQRIFVFTGSEPQRLDHYLTACLDQFSRSRLQNLIRAGNVLVDGAPARKTGQLLEAGMTVAVDLPPVEPTALAAEPIPLDIIFENSDLLVVNKPAGMVVHPAAGNRSGTLVNAVLAHAPDIEGIGGELRPGIVHRLDKFTSGLILVAKNDRAHRSLQEQFRERTVEKTYLALVDGAPPTRSGVVDAAIGRDKSNRKRMAIVPPQRGRAAVTEYTTLEIFTAHSLLQAHPLTGRTHQIRVHLAFIGCPVVGDTVYGQKKRSVGIKQHFLHAARLRVNLPGEKEVREFEAPLPPALVRLLDGLRREQQA